MKRFEDAAAYIPRQMAGSLPRHIDLRAHGLSGPVRDQASVGACAGFAMTATLDNAARRLGRRDVMAALHVFATYAHRSTGFSQALRGRPITVEPFWPYDPVRACRFANHRTGQGCSRIYGVPNNSAQQDLRLMAEKRRADATGRLQIAGYEELETAPVDIEQIAMLIASGESLWASIAFHRDAWESLNGNGYDVLPPYPASNTLGHAVTLEGYRWTPRGRQFLMHNSWGTRWGRGGYAWIDETMLRSHLKLAYRVLVVDASVPVPRPEAHCPHGRLPLLDICAPPAAKLPTVSWPRWPSPS